MQGRRDAVCTGGLRSRSDNAVVVKRRSEEDSPRPDRRGPDDLNPCGSGERSRGPSSRSDRSGQEGSCLANGVDADLDSDVRCRSAYLSI